MRRYWTLIYFLLFTASSFCAAVPINFNTDSSIPGLVTVDNPKGSDGQPLFASDLNDPEVKNMPAVRSQDGMGICGAFATAAVLEHHYCKVNKIERCDQLPPEQRYSVLDLCRFDPGSNKVKNPKNADTYPKLINESANPTAMLFNAGLQAKSVIPESCAPFDGLVSKAQTPSEQSKIEKATWTNFKNAYDLYKKKSQKCADCALQELTSTAKEWKENYNLKNDIVDILKAFGAKTYNEFLSQLLIPEHCYDLGKDLPVPNYNMEIGLWPTEDKDQNYSSTIEKIKEVLKSDRPVIVNTLCLLEKPTKGCTAKTPNGETIYREHSLVVTGYRNMCPKNSKDKSKCYQLLKVHNSWGQTWQDKNNDGWVRADQLLDRTSYSKGAFSWLQSKG